MLAHKCAKKTLHLAATCVQTPKSHPAEVFNNSCSVRTVKHVKVVLMCDFMLR